MRRLATPVEWGVGSWPLPTDALINPFRGPGADPEEPAEDAEHRGPGAVRHVPQRSGDHRRADDLSGALPSSHLRLSCQVNGWLDAGGGGQHSTKIFEQKLAAAQPKWRFG